MSGLFALDGRVVVVTGAGRGIGRALASGLAGEGARVFGLDLAFPDDTEEFAAIVTDVRDEAAAAEALQTIVAAAGRLDGLVNAAGITLPGEDTYSRDTFERTVATNLLAPLLLCRLAVEHMRRAGAGSIVNITSLGAHVGFPGNPAYQAAKAGLRQATRAMAVDFGAHGIRVNNLCPGYVRTPMTQRSFDDPALRLARTERTLLGRWAEPADLVGPCAFLLSDAARYVTGIDLPVDGGWLAKGL